MAEDSQFEQKPMKGLTFVGFCGMSPVQIWSAALLFTNRIVKPMTFASLNIGEISVTVALVFASAYVSVEKSLMDGIIFFIVGALVLLLLLFFATYLEVEARKELKRYGIH